MGPSDEKRGGFDIGGGEESFVGEDHRDGDEPIKGDGKSDVGHLMGERDGNGGIVGVGATVADAFVDVSFWLCCLLQTLLCVACAL